MATQALGTLAEPLTAGALAGVGSYMIAPELSSINLPIINREVSTPLAVGAITAVSSGLSAVLSNYVVPMFQDPRYVSFASDALPPIGTGVITYAMVRFGDPGAGGQAFTAAKVGLMATTAQYLANNVGDLFAPVAQS